MLFFFLKKKLKLLKLIKSTEIKFLKRINLYAKSKNVTPQGKQVARQILYDQWKRKFEVIQKKKNH